VGGDEQRFLVLEVIEEARTLDADPVGDSCILAPAKPSRANVT
jgi:hypothetical protein